MKRIFSVKTAILLILILATAMMGVACTPETSPTPTPTPTHVHEFNIDIPVPSALAVAQSCTNAARFYYRCECGAMSTETYEYGTPSQHYFSEWTANGDGTHTRTCILCCTYSETLDCYGGTATCQSLATCCACGSEYGSIGAHDVYLTRWYYSATHHHRTCNTDYCTEKFDYEPHHYDSSKICTTCGYQTNAAVVGTGIAGEFFEIQGTVLTATVANSQPDINFANVIEVAYDASFVVSTDVQGLETIDDYRAVLNEGDNVFYITVTADGYATSVYTVNIYRKHLYKLTFDAAGGAPIDDVWVEEGTVMNAPLATRPGYDFAGWGYDFYYPITESMDLTAIWSVRFGTEYITEYYFETLSGGFEKDESKTTVCQDYTDAVVTAWCRPFDGFTVVDTDVSGKNSAETQLVLKVYYTRNTCSVRTYVDFPEWGNVVGDADYKYGETATVKATPNHGYRFVGWERADSIVSTAMEYAFEVDAELVYLKAVFAENETAEYTTRHWLENLNDSGYTLMEGGEDVITAATNSYVYLSALDIPHFEATESKVGGTVDCKGTLVLEIFYTRNVYTVSADQAHGGVENGGAYKYGTQLTFTAQPNPGYEFTGWYSGNEELSPGESLSITLDRNITAHYAVRDEMKNFVFTATATNCIITDVRSPKVTEMVVPDYVTSIAEGALRRCTELVSLTMPAIKIGSGSQHIDSLWGSVDINNYGANVPDTLTTVVVTDGTGYGYSFEGCRSLSSVSLGRNVQGSFRNSGVESVVFADGITNINVAAFTDCKGLAEIRLPNTLKIIYNSAFSNCWSLTSVVLPESLELIYPNAFSGCTTLKDLTIGNNVAEIGRGAFSGTMSMENVYYGGTVSDWMDIYFETDHAVPTFSGANLHVGGELLTELVIPDGVTEIQSNAFYGCESITSIVVPDGVLSIGSYAFGRCNSLVSIVLPYVGGSMGSTDPFYKVFGGAASSVPDSLKNVIITSGTSIGTSAFEGCDMLESVQLPDELETVGDRAFYGCSALQSISIPIGTNYFGSRAFFGCESLGTVYFAGTTLDWLYTDFIHEYANPASYARNVYMAGDLIKDFVVPDDVTAIGWYQFQTPAFDSIVLHSGVDYVGAAAFSGSTAQIEWVGLPTITRIEGYAYENYLGASITIPATVTELGASTFAGTSAVINWADDPAIFHLDSYAFAGYCGEQIMIPDSVLSLGDYLFSGSSAGIVWGNNPGVRAIWDVTFGGYAGDALSLPGCIEVIAKGALQTCTSLVELELPFLPGGYLGYVFGADDTYDQATCVSANLRKVALTKTSALGEKAFWRVDQLESITLCEGITQIPYMAFAGCTDLDVLEIPDSVTVVGQSAFASMKGEIVFGVNSRLSNLSYESVYGYNGATFTIPSGVTNIGAYAFSACTAEISFADGFAMDTIPANAFARYRGASFTIPACVKKIGSGAFMGSSLVNVVVPGNITEIGAGAFEGCDQLESVVIASSVSSIGSGAFESCDVLAAIYYQGTAEEWGCVSIDTTSYPFNEEILYFWAENKESLPDEGNFWHYVDGVPTVWVREQE